MELSILIPPRRRSVVGAGILLFVVKDPLTGTRRKAKGDERIITKESDWKQKEGETKGRMLAF